MTAGFRYQWIFLALLCTSSVTAGTNAAGPAPTLIDRWGQEHQWTIEGLPNSFGTSTPRGYVLAFLSHQCPLVNRFYGPVLRELDERFRKERIQFIGVYSDTGSTRLQMASHKQRFNFGFPVYLDESSRLAARMGAQRTPQVLLLDAQGAIKYSGRIDDSVWEGSAKSKPIVAEQQYLLNAILALLTGKSPSPTRTLVRGCEIVTADSMSRRPAVADSHQAEMVVHSRCLQCHSKGGPGGLCFESFSEVQANKDTIFRVVKYQRMPPPGADGSSGHPLKQSCELPDEERLAILDWIACGMPRTVAKEAFAEPHNSARASNQFTIGSGKPDQVFTLLKPFTVRAHGDLDYQFFWLPAQFDQERWIREVEILPGDRRVVHHAQVHLKERSARDIYLKKLSGGGYDFSKPIEGAAVMADFYGLSGEKSRRITSYLPGNEFNARRLAPNTAIRVPAGMDLVLEIHYTPCGQETSDQSKVGIVLANGPPTTEVHDGVFSKPRNFAIPPNDPHYCLTDEFYFKKNVLLLDARMHFVLAGSILSSNSKCLEER